MIIDVLVYIFLAYLAIGVLFSIAFVVKGVDAIDNEAARSPKTFRIVLVPGAILLWPVLIIKWMKA